jgi:hypothetical protein
MKRILLVPCFLILIAGAALAQESSSWKRYTVKGEEFSVKLPTLPALTTSTDFIKEEKRERVQRQFGAYADGVVYTILSVDDGKPQKMLKALSGGSGSSLGWDRSTEQEVARDGFAGKQYTSRNPLGGTAQLFATGIHFYLFQAFGAPAEDARVQQFFSSLKLGPATEGVEVSDGEGTPWGARGRLHIS